MSEILRLHQYSVSLNYHVYTSKGNVQCCVEVLSAELVKNDGLEAPSHLRQLTLTQKLSVNTKQSEQNRTQYTTHDTHN